MGLSRSQKPAPLLRIVRGVVREEFKTAEDAMPDYTASSNGKDTGPRVFKSKAKEFLMPGSDMDSSDESDNKRTGRGDIQGTDFKAPSAKSKVTKKPENTSNKRARAGRASFKRSSSSPMSEKRRKLSSDDDGDDDDDDEIKEPVKPSSSKIVSRKKKPSPSSSISNSRNSQDPIQSWSQPKRLSQTYGTKSKGAKTVRKKPQEKEPEEEPAAYKHIPMSDDNVDTPKKTAKFKTLPDEAQTPTSDASSKKSKGHQNSSQSSQTVTTTINRSKSFLNRFDNPKMKTKKRRKSKEEDEDPHAAAVFKADFDSQALSPVREGDNLDMEETLSSDEGNDGNNEESTQAPEDATDGEEIPQPVSLCPWCGEEVDHDLLRKFSKGERMNVRLQTKFCQQHKKHTARQTWLSKSYPTIDWEELPLRIMSHHDALLDIVDGEESYYRSRLAEKIKEGTSRSMKKEENLNPGYYGPRGFNLMCDRLVDRFSNLLKEKAVKDRVISGRGSAAFIQSVLVAELATLLIMEDMGVPYDEARDIMEESKAIGEIVNEEG